MKIKKEYSKMTPLERIRETWREDSMYSKFKRWLTALHNKRKIVKLEQSSKGGNEKNMDNNISEAFDKGQKERLVKNLENFLVSEKGFVIVFNSKENNLLKFAYDMSEEEVVSVLSKLVFVDK